MTDFHVPTSSGFVVLNASPGYPLFVVGRNGSGKSALIHFIYGQAAAKSIYIPGSRTSIFDGEGLSLTPASRKQLSSNLASFDSSPDVRWRNIMNNNSRNEKAIHDLIASDIQYKGDIAAAISNGQNITENVVKLQSKSAPLDKVNMLFEQATMPVRMAFQDGELKARSGSSLYSFARMSDGERIALILSSEVVAAKNGTIFIIDEPELHLHRSIVVPLIASLIKMRPDCEFIVSTHELDLPTSISQAKVCIVRSAAWGPVGVVSTWDLDLIESPDALPEDLKTDVLGSRRRVLFTEGTDQSLDVPMYSILFPKSSIIPKGGCREVQRAVHGLNLTTGLHRTLGYGLVDNDGMSTDQITKLQSDGIYALPLFSVESIYYDVDVVKAVAERQAGTMAASESDQQKLIDEYLADAVKQAKAAADVTGVAEHLAGRMSEKLVRDALIVQLPKRDELIEAASPIITISGQSPYPAELRRFKELIAAGDVFGVIARYPARHSGILSAVAKALKFKSRTEYEAAALTRVTSDFNLRAQLLAKLAPLSLILNA